MSDLSQYRLPSPLEDALHARKMAAPMESRCFVCGAIFTGAAADVIQAAAAHRAEVHPELKDRGVRARREAARTQ